MCRFRVLSVLGYSWYPNLSPLTSTIFFCIKAKLIYMLEPQIYVCQVVQQNKWIECLGLFKHWVLKLLNLINIRRCHTLRKISIFSNPPWWVHPPFGYCYSRSFTAYLSCDSCSLSSSMMHPYICQWLESMHFYNMLASNHTIKLIKHRHWHLPFIWIGELWKINAGVWIDTGLI